MNSLQRQLHALINEEDYKNFIKINLECPLPCRVGEPYHFIQEELVELWISYCRDYSTAQEEEFIRKPDEEEAFLFNIEDCDEFKRVSINLTGWIEKAKKKFLERTDILNSTMASSEVYKKHLISRNVSLEEIVKKAKQDKVSYLFSDVTVELLNSLLKESYKTYFKLVIASDTIRYGVKVKNTAGVSSSGNESCWMLFEINRSSKVAHAYPCDSFEIERLSIVPKFCDLQHLF